MPMQSPVLTPSSAAAPALLRIEQLAVQVRTTRGVAEPVQPFSLTLQRGETLGLIGESGSGKTLAMLALMGLLPRNAQAQGSVRLNGQELLQLDEKLWLFFFLVQPNLRT